MQAEYDPAEEEDIIDDGLPVDAADSDEEEGSAKKRGKLHHTFAIMLTSSII